MRKLGLLRHAHAEFSDGTMRDFDRALDVRGQEDARTMGRVLIRRGRDWNVILCSPAVRARQTLALSLPRAEAVFDERLYLAPADVIVDILREHSESVADILLVGHNPGLQDVLTLLVGVERRNNAFERATTEFPTASLAVVDFADVWLGEAGNLAAFEGPRVAQPFGEP